MTKGAFIIKCKEKYPRHVEGMEFKAINPETNTGLTCVYVSKLSPLCHVKLAWLDRDGNATFLEDGR